MKYLFVCRANVGRSQAAMALYNATHTELSESAGTITQAHTVALKDREVAKNIIFVMKEHGIDISENIPQQITEEMVDNFDKVVVMAEPESIPDWLKSHPKTEIWDIQDAKGQDIETTRKIVNQIQERVNRL